METGTLAYYAFNNDVTMMSLSDHPCNRQT
jgi:hypothetical protein